MSNPKVMRVTKCTEHNGEDGTPFYGVQVAVEARKGNALIESKAKLFWLPSRRTPIKVDSLFMVDMDAFNAEELTNEVGTFTKLTTNDKYDAEKSVRSLAAVAAPKKGATV